MEFKNRLEDEKEAMQHLKKLERKRKRIKRAYNKQSRKYSRNKGSRKTSQTKEIVMVKRLPCHLFRMGKCDKGDSCDFSHDIVQGVKSQLCRFYIVNACTNENCQFSHDKSKFQCKYLYITGKCEKNSRCLFNHQSFESESQLCDFIQSNIDMIIDCLKNNILTATNRYARDNKLLIKVNEEAIANLLQKKEHSEVSEAECQAEVDCSGEESAIFR